MNDRDLEQHVAGCTLAEQRLVSHLDALADTGALNDAVIAQPSRLPNWSVGHVITHLARNADSFTRIIDGALRGETADQYIGGLAGRVADIESGAARPAREQIDDLRASCVALQSGWARCRSNGWLGNWRSVIAGERPIKEVPFRRWREVEIHHADLGLAGFDFEDWSARYVNEDLTLRTMEWSSRNPMGLTSLPPAALKLSPSIRLAWLVGRVNPEGLDPVRFG